MPRSFSWSIYSVSRISLNCIKGIMGKKIFTDFRLVLETLSSVDHNEIMGLRDIIGAIPRHVLQMIEICSPA